MSNSSRRRSGGGSGPVLRSLSPSGRFQSAQSNGSSSASFASSTSSSFYSPPSTLFNHHHQHHRSASPTRVNLFTPFASSFSVSINSRSGSPNPSITVSKRNSTPKKTCMCSPTTHPGSFRCSLHKNSGNSHGHSSGSYPSNRLNMRRSAMTNSLVRIGGVEGEWVRRALTALIRPSSHQQRRRSAFQPRRSRLSTMTKADESLI